MSLLSRNILFFGYSSHQIAQAQDLSKNFSELVIFFRKTIFQYHLLN